MPIDVSDVVDVGKMRFEMEGPFGLVLAHVA